MKVELPKSSVSNLGKSITQRQRLGQLESSLILPSWKEETPILRDRKDGKSTPHPARSPITLQLQRSLVEVEADMIEVAHFQHVQSIQVFNHGRSIVREGVSPHSQLLHLWAVLHSEVTIWVSRIATLLFCEAVHSDHHLPEEWEGNEIQLVHVLVAVVANHQLLQLTESSEVQLGCRVLVATVVLHGDVCHRGVNRIQLGQ